jgi:hypothetical protein
MSLAPVIELCLSIPRPSAISNSAGRPDTAENRVAASNLVGQRLGGTFDVLRCIAEAACDLAERANDPASAALMRVSHSLLERVFLARLRPLSRRLVPAWIGSSPALSPRTMFLLSRLDGRMTVEDALDVASMPRLDAPRRLVQLVTCGALRLE